MLERPLAALLGIPLLDMMHGSQRTACFAGERDLPELIARLRSPPAPPGNGDEDRRGGPARRPSP
jgi:hypothetical protein